MRLRDLATTTHFHFQIIYGPQNVGCILGIVENGKGKLMGKYVKKFSDVLQHNDYLLDHIFYMYAARCFP